MKEREVLKLKEEGHLVHIVSVLRTPGSNRYIGSFELKSLNDSTFSSDVFVDPKMLVNIVSADDGVRRVCET